MGRVKFVRFAAAVVPLLLVLFCLSCGSGKKPDKSVLKEREVLFTAYTQALAPGESLYLTGAWLPAPLAMEFKEDRYQISAVVAGGRMYRYVAGDEWGNVYDGIKHDSAGDRPLAASQNKTEDVIESFAGSFALPTVQISLLIISDAPRLYMTGELTQGNETKLNRISMQSDERYVFGGDFTVRVGKNEFKLYAYKEATDTRIYCIEASKDKRSFRFEANFGLAYKDVSITVILKKELAFMQTLWLKTAGGGVNFLLLQRVNTLTYRIGLKAPLTEAYGFAVYLAEGDSAEDIIFDPIARFNLDIYSGADFTCYLDNGGS